MSYSVFVQRFAHGDAAPMDDALAQELLAPYVVRSEPEFGFVRIAASDGGRADVYASPGSLMVSRFSWGGILDVLAGLVERLDAVLLLQEGVAVLATAGQRAHLPPELQPDAVVVDLTGAAVRAVIEGL
ncbi:hypothetical protein [Actinacidiphila rubida]|uniref:SseB protein N-terminal domain-containing protein n=1 Tax=Actinacidiphila rubida TaxID=310780 RepID=A0A1H8E8C4_9ACTN|nr:hypothetical protein [Actinacidiphila rubida]SEN15831.1 hypothetical protein SAMN05216267_100273 [Actinacidiphila rubida]